MSAKSLCATLQPPPYETEFSMSNNYIVHLFPFPVNRGNIGHLSTDCFIGSLYVGISNLHVYLGRIDIFVP